MHVFGINSGFLGIPSSRTDRRLKKSATFRQKSPTLGKVTFWVLHEYEEPDEFLENLVFPPKGMLKSFSKKNFSSPYFNLSDYLLAYIVCLCAARGK